MRYLIFIYIFILSSNPSFAKYGSGPLKLDKNTMETAIMYMYGAGNKKYSGSAKRKNNPDIMAVSKDGRTSNYMYCPAEYHNGCIDPNSAQLIKACEKYSNGSPCFIFAKKRRIVWKNGGSKVKIKKKDLKSPYVVAKKIQEGGFYDGDIKKLIGIDIETGQVNEEIKITGEKDTKEKKITKTKDGDIVKELETLTKLYENGSLTKEEFDKAKEKLFNN
jgi:hypothetical protein